MPTKTLGFVELVVFVANVLLIIIINNIILDLFEIWTNFHRMALSSQFSLCCLDKPKSVKDEPGWSRSEDEQF